MWYLVGYEGRKKITVNFELSINDNKERICFKICST